MTDSLVVTDGSAEQPLPAPGPELRASDDDRDAVVRRLRDAVGRGALDLAELEARLEAVYASKTLPQLAELTADLPAPRPEPPAASTSPVPGISEIPALRSPTFQFHLLVYVLTIGFLVGIWVLSGFGHPWPFYPAAGWGIGLGSHFLVANNHQRNKAERRQFQLERRNERHEARAERHHYRHDARDERPDPRGGPRGGSFASSPAPPPTPPPPVGAPAHTPPSASARSYIAAMFVDVVGSTELNETLGDAGWARVREHHRQLLRECFEDQAGTEVNAAGDGVLARFDHPAAAARAAVEIQRRLERQREETGFAPSVRIGIHSGDVVDEGADVIGSVVNLAARVTDAADPDEIMITEHVADHLPEQLASVDRGIHTLKGVTRPRHLLALCWR